MYLSNEKNRFAYPSALFTSLVWHSSTNQIYVSKTATFECKLLGINRSYSVSGQMNGPKKVHASLICVLLTQIWCILCLCRNNWYALKLHFIMTLIFTIVRPCYFFTQNTYPYPFLCHAIKPLVILELAWWHSSASLNRCILLKGPFYASYRSIEWSINLISLLLLPVI